MVTVLAVGTAALLTVNVAVVLPAATMTDAGTIAAVLLLASAISAPPLGAGAVNVTVPAELAPAVRLPGSKTTDERAAGMGEIVNVALLITPLPVADIVAVIAVATVAVV